MENGHLFRNRIEDGLVFSWRGIWRKKLRTRLGKKSLRTIRSSELRASKPFAVQQMAEFRHRDAASYRLRTLSPNRRRTSDPRTDLKRNSELEQSVAMRSPIPGVWIFKADTRSAPPCQAKPLRISNLPNWATEVPSVLSSLIAWTIKNSRPISSRSPYLLLLFI